VFASKSELVKITTHRERRGPRWHTWRMKLALNRAIVVLLGVICGAAILGGVFLTFSPLIAPYPTGGTGNCGALAGLIVRGGETRNNGGELPSGVFEAWVDTCRAATVVGAGVLVGLALLAIGSAWGATVVHGRQWRARLPRAGSATSNRL